MQNINQHNTNLLAAIQTRSADAPAELASWLTAGLPDLDTARQAYALTDEELTLGQPTIERRTEVDPVLDTYMSKVDGSYQADTGSRETPEWLKRGGKSDAQAYADFFAELANHQNLTDAVVISFGGITREAAEALYARRKALVLKETKKAEVIVKTNKAIDYRALLHGILRTLGVSGSEIRGIEIA